MHNTIKENVFKDVQETLWVYLRATNTKTTNYDPDYNTGYTKTLQAPIPVKAMVRPLTPESLIMREIGSSETGAIEIVVEEKDEGAFKACDKVEYKSVEYVTRREALGNKFYVVPTIYGFSKIVLFRRGNK